jgi:hypothetical protein
MPFTNELFPDPVAPITAIRLHLKSSLDFLREDDGSTKADIGISFGESAQIKRAAKTNLEDV